jgi:hypothetical protein
MKAGKMDSSNIVRAGMKPARGRLLSVAAACLLVAAGNAAALSCNDKPGRYVNHDVFSTLKETPNIQFGSNKNPLHNNATETLSTDIFMPANDTCTRRPLILFMWGGGFQSGTRQGETGDCRAFAKRGFVCATTDYRKGNAGAYNIRNFCSPTFMSAQDTRAAVRFFRKNADQYGIDTSLIYVGGCSSGAYAAMHTAYLDQDYEIPSYLMTDVTAGGTEGTSGNPGYSSKVAGVLSLSGGLFDSNWVEKGSVPAAAVMCAKDGIESPDSLHDGTGGKAFVKNFDMARLGQRFKSMGIQTLVKSYPQDCHCPHFTGADGQDETVDFLAKSAYKFMTTPVTVRVRPILALSDRDLGGTADGGVWVDARGTRVDARAGARTADFHPGLYFRIRPEGAAARP